MNKYLKLIKDSKPMSYAMTNDSIDESILSFFKKLPTKQKHKARSLFSYRAFNNLIDFINGEEDISIFPNVDNSFIIKIINQHKLPKRIEYSKHYVLNLLLKTFLLNKNVKKEAYDTFTCSECNSEGCWVCDSFGYITEVNYQLRNKLYLIKTYNLLTIVSILKRNNFGIKYGYKDGVIYFELNGKQMSFHDPHYIFKYIKTKPFQGQWNGIENKVFPFYKELHIKKS